MDNEQRAKLAMLLLMLRSGGAPAQGSANPAALAMALRKPQMPPAPPPVPAPQPNPPIAQQ